MVLGNLGTNVSNFVHKLQCTYFVNQGKDFFFFAREGKWDAQTTHLLSFAISARNVRITKKCHKGSVQNRGGGGSAGRISPLPPPLPSVSIPVNPPHPCQNFCIQHLPMLPFSLLYYEEYNGTSLIRTSTSLFGACTCIPDCSGTPPSDQSGGHGTTHCG